MNLRKTVEELDKKYHDRKVVLVDENDKELGVAGLVEAHRGKGMQHRAFSLQLYRVNNGKKELLLQKRAAEKPVFPFYWANTCCHNMVLGEEYINRSVSRVKEEMGAEVREKELRELYKFTYYAPDLEGWCENELDNVIVGKWDGELKLNPEEALAAKWVEWGELNMNIEESPEIYTPWFKIMMQDKRFRQAFE